jgi:protein O-GlcNAc transferase
VRGGVRDRLLGQFADHGVSPDRIEIRIATVANFAHLALYHEIDVALDAFPWTGHTTTCDALWMGVPVLTLRGTRHAGRMAASVLSAVGLAEMVTQSPEEFVARAIQLAADTEALAELRAGLRERMRVSPLCDATTFTRGLEDTFRALWQRWGQQAVSGFPLSRE